MGWFGSEISGDGDIVSVECVLLILQLGLGDTRSDDSFFYFDSVLE